jgi:hypothetical protein
LESVHSDQRAPQHQVSREPCRPYLKC